MDDKMKSYRRKVQRSAAAKKFACTRKRNQAISPTS